MDFLSKGLIKKLLKPSEAAERPLTNGLESEPGTSYSEAEDGAEFRKETRDDRELAAAREHFSTGEVGAPAKYAAPFTEQLMVETEIQFPIDSDQYTEARRIQRYVVRTYFAMRVFTLGLFFIAAFVQASIFQSWSSDAMGSEMKLPEPEFFGEFFGGMGTTGLGLWLLGVALGFFGLRLLTRFFVFFELTRRAERLSFQVFKRIDDIETRVTEACSKVRLRVGDNWPGRAKNWIIIALWNAKRAEYLDRFISTVIWRVGTYIRQLQGVFFFLNLAVATTLLVLIGAIDLEQGLGGMGANAVFAVFLYAQSWLLWHKADQKPDNFWTDEFRRSAPTVDEDTERYVDKISDEIENLVHEVLSKEFGQAPRPN